ncbi:MAG TPA: MFS transporter [Dehalococcoidia bacterium]|nr:MFS transporter [Dehalococcoidia bacterium]
MRKDFSGFSDRNKNEGPVEVTGKNEGWFTRFLNLRTFASLKNPTYRLYWGALVCQMASMNMQLLARSLLVYRLTGSAAILGAMSLAHAVPLLVFSLYGGVIADRIQKKYVMLIGQAGSAIVSLGVALSLMLGYLSTENEGSWWILVVASVFQGTIMGLMMPSRQAVLPEIVSQEQLMNALSLSNMGSNVIRLLAPAAAGFLIDAFDFQAVYFTMTGLYSLAVLFVSLLPLTGTVTLRKNSALTDIKEGLRYLRHQKTIVFILLFTLVAVVLSMPYLMLMPIFTEDILMVGAGGMGILLSVSGVGAIAGSLVLASLPNKRRGMMLIFSGILMGIALAGFAFSTSWPLSLGIIVIVGLAQAGRMTLSNTLIQYYVENEYRGRVMSIYMMEFGLTSFGTFAAGVMAEAWGVQWVVGGFAMTLAVVSLIVFLFVGRIRKLD